MKYFKKIESVQELRNAYFTRIVDFDSEQRKNEKKELDEEYEKLFSYFKNEFENSEDYEKATERLKQSFDYKKDRKIREMLVKLACLDDLEVEVIGTWIWVAGNTKFCKKELHDLGLHWAHKKQMWYIYYDDFYSSRKKAPLTMGQIREKFGFEKHEKKPSPVFG